MQKYSKKWLSSVALRCSLSSGLTSDAWYSNYTNGASVHCRNSIKRSVLVVTFYFYWHYVFRSIFLMPEKVTFISFVVDDWNWNEWMSECYEAECHFLLIRDSKTTSESLQQGKNTECITGACYLEVTTPLPQETSISRGFIYNYSHCTRRQSTSYCHTQTHVHIYKLPLQVASAEVCTKSATSVVERNASAGLRESSLIRA